jgi:hypothetical protein
MRREKSVVSVLILALALSVQATADEPDPLGLPLFPVPIVRQNVPLTQALSDVGAHVRNGYAQFGIELRLKDDREPQVNVDLKPGSTLGDALRQIFQQVPGYTFDVVSEHLIDIYPVGANKDASDLLNLRVPFFDAVDAQLGDILTRPQEFIPELKARLVRRRPGEPGGVLGGPLSSVGPTFTLHLRRVTVRQILNAVSQATEKFPAERSPLGWICSFKADPTLPAGGVYTWDVHWSVPHDWKTQAQGQSKK